MKTIKSFSNNNLPIVDAGNDTLDRTYFNIVRLAPREEYHFSTGSFEMVHVVLSGQCDIRAGESHFPAVGQRSDIWSGCADSVYVPPETQVCIRAGEAATEVAIAGGLADPWEGKAFRIRPDEVDTVEVGSSETKTLRRIRHILGKNAENRSKFLLVSELYAGEGCWSGYPPHKHDTDREGEETAHEELYHFRFQPETGFGAQFCYVPGEATDCVMTQNGDTCLIREGYHPTVTSPGHQEYILAVLVGKQHRGLIQYFEPKHQYMMERFPGISEMRDKFK